LVLICALVTLSFKAAMSLVVINGSVYIRIKFVKDLFLLLIKLCYPFLESTYRVFQTFCTLVEELEALEATSHVVVQDNFEG
jgi:hypothetical protein